MSRIAEEDGFVVGLEPAWSLMSNRSPVASREAIRV